MLGNSVSWPGRRGIAERRLRQLGVRRRCEVDIQHVGQENEIQQNVRYFFPCPGVKGLRPAVFDSICCGQPLKKLGQLTNLTDEGEQHGLRVVETGPVTLCCKQAHAITQCQQVGRPPLTGVGFLVAHAVSMTRVSVRRSLADR